MKKIYFVSFIIISCIIGTIYLQSTKISYSVIIPVYNAEKFLARCLDSVLNQSGTFEVIAVNDGSSDKSREILEEYAKKYSNLIVINQENRGISGARNRGLEVARMKYITFLDNDDWFEPNIFKNMSKIIKEHNPDVILTNYYDVYDREWVRRTSGEEAAQKAPEESKYIAHYIDKLALFSVFYGKEAHSDLWYMGFAHGQFYRKEFLDRYNIKFIDTLGEDVLFNYQIFSHNPKIFASPLPVYDFHNRVDSVSKSAKLMTGIPKTLKIWKETEEFKQSDRRTQMFMLDGFLFWWIMSAINLQRHNKPLDECIAQATAALYEFASQYNKEELKVCRHFRQLYNFIYNENY